MESVPEGGPPNVVRCPNCGSDRVESDCAGCGQRAGDLHVPVSAFVRDALDGFFLFRFEDLDNAANAAGPWPAGW